VPQLWTQAFTSPSGTAWRERDGLGQHGPNLLAPFGREFAKASFRIGVEF
jgi:hypothetical protein